MIRKIILNENEIAKAVAAWVKSKYPTHTPKTVQVTANPTSIGYGESEATTVKITATIEYEDVSDSK
jgi:hypothetical protein